MFHLHKSLARKRARPPEALVHWLQRYQHCEDEHHGHDDPEDDVRERALPPFETMLQLDKVQGVIFSVDAIPICFSSCGALKSCHQVRILLRALPNLNDCLPNQDPCVSQGNHDQHSPNYLCYDLCEQGNHADEEQESTDAKDD